MFGKIVKTGLLAVSVMLAGNAHVFAEPLQARAELVDTEGKNVGRVTFTENAEGVVNIELKVHSFIPGTHAFHIHGSPVCQGPDFKSAGGHFNPTGKEHGFLNAKGHHAGDLPNIVVDEEGHGLASFTTTEITLKTGEVNSILGGPGTAIVVHENPDDYFTDPAGRGGKRIACGTIIQAE